MSASPQDTCAEGLAVRFLGREEFLAVWQRMQEFTARRGAGQPDEIWVVEHPPVYTLGLNCRRAPLERSDIPVVATDRGGQITFHGPGQVVVYVLLDLKRRGRGVKWLVSLLEQSVIDLLASYGVSAARRAGAPGVYVEGRKIAALGLRVRRGACYHGLSLNVDMDLTPFENIDPCGFPDLEVVQLRDLGVDRALDDVGRDLVRRLTEMIDKS